MSARIASRMPRLLLALTLSACVAARAGAAPEEDLLGALRGDLSRPQLRCEWVAGHFARADRTLSVYRQELARLYVAVDGIRITDSAGGGLRRIEFETRLFGPGSATVSVDTGRAPAAARARSGAQLEIGFTDRRGGAHPLFCGTIAALRHDASVRRTELVALMPRVGGEGRRSAQYTDMTLIDVLTAVAGEAGLQLEVRDTRPYPVQPVIVRKAMADWPYLRWLARLLSMEIVLPNDGVLRATPSAFTPPPLPASRDWTAMTWIEIAERIAAESGRRLDAETSADYPATDRRQRTATDDFLADLAADHEASAWWSGDRLVLREDRVWSRNPAAEDAPAMTIALQQFAAAIAGRHGLTLDAGAVPGVQTTVVRRQETDAQLLLRVLGTAGVRLDYRAGTLYLRAAAAPDDVSDLLLQRIVVFGSLARERRFERRYGDPRVQIMDPEGVATTEVLLDLGTMLPLSDPPAGRLADAASVAIELEAALGRLAARSVQTPQSGFLRELARSYRPTLLHQYRLRQDGAKVLRTIAAQP